MKLYFVLLFTSFLSCFFNGIFALKCVCYENGNGILEKVFSKYLTPAQGKSGENYCTPTQDNSTATCTPPEGFGCFRVQIPVPGSGTPIGAAFCGSPEFRMPANNITSALQWLLKKRKKSGISLPLLDTCGTSGVGLCACDSSDLCNAEPVSSSAAASTGEKPKLPTEDTHGTGPGGAGSGSSTVAATAGFFWQATSALVLGYAWRSLWVH